ncbi:7137_t:CDS:10 [Diversispora eburnea]|uniref:7137_t:CDS:1 n=1 Tax=Diversispora eburnea TaxID=1213867 RepID=A0A9N9C1D9_9GLOM|nr:7137_t:CDS:10 [Diversispora eburnea]
MRNHAISSDTITNETIITEITNNESILTEITNNETTNETSQHQQNHDNKIGQIHDKKFTWEELAKHNTRDDAYVSIRGNVYDITGFITRHPGGEDVLLFAAGRDATQRVEGYFRKNGIDPKNSPSIWIRYALIYGSLIGSYYGQFYISSIVERTWLQIILAIILGFSCSQVGLNQLHDSSHFSVTHDPFVWRILGATHDFLNGCSSLIWMYQHVLGHHIYTNIAGADPDVLTHDPDIRRIKPNQRWYSRYINQHIFVPILYGFLAIKVRFQDINIAYIIGSNDNIRLNSLTNWQTFIFWVLTLFAISDAIASYWLALTFQANHVVDEVEWPLPDKNGLVKKDWAEMQETFWEAISSHIEFLKLMSINPNVDGKIDKTD